MEQPLWRARREAAARTRPEPRSTIKSVAEAFSLISAALFLSGIAVNEYAFRAWGLSFLQIASAQDAVMAGLSAAYIAAPFCATFAISVYIFKRLLPRGWELPGNLIGLF